MGQIKNIKLHIVTDIKIKVPQRLFIKIVVEMPKDGNQTSSCPMWPNQPHQCNTILRLKYAFSSISLIACIVVLALIWLFRHHKNGVQRLILFLTVSACVLSFGFIIGDYHTSGGTWTFQGFLIQYFNWSTILWVCAISVYILLHVRDFDPSRYEKWFHLVCWIVPFILACIPFGGSKYGRSGVWCWIQYDQAVLRFATWYIPKIILILAMIGLYVYVLVAVIRRRDTWSGTFNPEEQHDRLMLANEVKPLVAFPLIYVVLSIPSIIYRIDDAVRPNTEPSFTLSVLMVIASPSVGALNAVVFATYTEVLTQLSSWSHVRVQFLSHFTKFGGVVHNVSVDDGPIVDDMEDTEWGTSITM